jgi:alpha-galactosidase/6-phospho-beta-glucosidase family protein
MIQYAIRRYTSVSVLGTCDAPVSLMEAIAGVLESPVEALDFDLAGMHHFTWIVGVREQQVDRFGELLARADKLSALGTDPSVIKAYQAIPSKYFKYYVHPDKVLAGAKESPPRAAQLMDLGERIQAGYRKWQADEPPTMLDLRGAVWYHQIVAPALLALAEKRTERLVLSVDNRQVFPWLPEDAIVEGQVSIVRGLAGKAVPVELPADIRALIAQNCAYEQLAVEAIVEENREKALRALLSNLMVHTHTQASRILDELWPA